MDAVIDAIYSCFYISFAHSYAVLFRSLCSIFNIFSLFSSPSNKMGRRQSQRKPVQPQCVFPRQENNNEKVSVRRTEKT